MARFGFVGGSYTSESINADCQSTINWYPESVESQGGTAAVAMYPTAGLAPFATIAGSAVRGLYYFNGRLFGVGANFSEILSDGQAIGYSFLPVDNDPVTMAANNANQLIICAGGELWLFPLASGSIVYNNVPSTITQIQIVDNGDPLVKDYYVTTASLAGYTVGTTLTFAGLTELTFLNGVTGTINSIAGNIAHLQMPRSLTLGFSQTITNAVLAANSPVNVSNYAISGSSTGSPAWHNPGFVGSLTQYSYFPALPGTSFAAAYVVGNQFGFNIPIGASVTGIQVTFYREVDNVGAFTSAYTNGVQMYKAGSPAGTPHIGGSAWTGSFVQETYGNSSDLWGTTWAYSDINNAGFGAGVQGYFDNNDSVTHQGRVQQLNVTVWYTTFNGTLTLSQTCCFTNTGEPVAFSGLTNNLLMNGNSYPQVSASGTSLVVSGAPGPAYSGAETGTATAEIVNLTLTETGTISGKVISYGTSPVQVAIGQGPFASVDFVDGYFLALIENSQNFQISGLEDGTTWNPLYEYQVEEYADNIISMLVDHREIWFMGPKRSLVYYDSGDSLTPFQPIPGAFIEQGIAAASSLVRMDNSIFWLGADERGQGIAWRANGYTPVRVSNHAVENAWRQYPTIMDAIAFTFQDNGHTFWQIWFPSANATWVYDAATSQWHQRTWYSNGVANAHLARCHAFAFGQHLVGDRASGAIYVQSIDNLSDTVYGTSYPIQRIRTAPHISNEQEWMFHQQLQVYLESGLGLSGSNSAISIFYLIDQSDVTWSVTINDGSGLVTSTSSNTEGEVIVFQDTADGKYYQVIITTIGTVGTRAVEQPSTFITDLQMQSITGLTTWTIVCTNGFLLASPISPVPPQIALDWSNDAGHTWSNKYLVSVGSIGQFSLRCMWRRLGRARDRVYRITCTDVVPYRIVDAYLTAVPGFSPQQRLIDRLKQQA